jgi:hypothetical protein
MCLSRAADHKPLTSALCFHQSPAPTTKPPTGAAARPTPLTFIRQPAAGVNIRPALTASASDAERPFPSQGTLRREQVLAERLVEVVGEEQPVSSGLEGGKSSLTRVLPHGGDRQMQEGGNTHGVKCCRARGSRCGSLFFNRGCELRVVERCGYGGRQLGQC